MKLTDVTNFNDQSRREEVANGISHGVGSFLALGGTALLIVFSAIYNDVMSIVTSSIYGVSLILLFTMSTLYHSFKNLKVKRIFQILDHSSVYVLIFGTYTPICLSLIKTPMAYIAWSFVTIMMILGIILNIIDLKRFHMTSMVFYLLMGWSAILVMKSLIEMLPVTALLLLVGGGIFYSVGVAFYLVKGPRYMHFIWHIFVLAGAVLHYFFVLFYVVLY